MQDNDFEKDKDMVQGQVSLDEILSDTTTEANLSTENVAVENEQEKLAETSDDDSGDHRGIIYRTIDEVLHDSMIPYTECVVMDRALPRVEDGLKPVQRRILYAMMELGMTPDKQYRKSARLVGDCLGKYHPHGDSSVYDAMCRMSQDFALRAPLVDGHGNFGSVDGDSPAAMRYTEARMAPLALELLRDLEKDTVRWSYNFDDTLKEPDMLPGRFPNLLVNGASGIAVGVATNIPPHNLGEVIDGVVAYIDKPTITLPEMMKYIKGPDFPTGGELIFEDGLQQAYESGKGKIMIRAKVNTETSGDKTSLVITELPYQVNKSALLQKIAELKELNKDKLSAISEIRDESDRTGMRAVIKLKKDAKPKKILEYLFKATNLQVSFGINMVAIAGGKPKLLGLMEIISYYTQYQREIIVRRTKFDLNAAKERAHIVEGLLIAIRNIDEVIKIIKKSSSVAEAKQKLKTRFNLSERQAQAILDMRLARLVNLEVEKLEQELKELKAKIAEYERILASKKVQLDVVKKELLDIKKAYNTPRRSTILKSSDIKLEEVSEVEEDTRAFVIAVSAGKTIKKVTTKNFSMSVKTLGDNSTITDVHTCILTASASEVLLFFTNKGNVLKIGVDKLKECKWRDKGFSLASLDKSASSDEYVVQIMPVGKEGNLLFYTKDGMVKKSSFVDCVVNKSFYQVMKLTSSDELIGVELEKTGKSVLMLSKNGMCLNFETSEVPQQGRISGGVRGMNLDSGDTLVFAGQLDFADVIVVTNNGYMKKLNVGTLPISPRYRKGLKYINFAGNGKTVAFVCAGGGNVTLAVDFGLKILPMETKKLPPQERLTSGNEIIKKKFLGIHKLMHDLK